MTLHSIKVLPLIILLTINIHAENNSSQASTGEFGFGIGLGGINLNQPDITSVVVDNGIVRVTGEEEQKLGVWLTTSWVIDKWNNPWNNKPFTHFAIGPFMGVQLGGGNNELVNSFSLGLDFSFKKTSPKLPLDFQIGWGWTKTKVLADAYIPNQKLPENSNSVLTKDIVTNGLVILVSYKF